MLLLAIDQGSHATRATLFDPVGNRLASQLIPIHTQHNSPHHHVEQQADEIVDSIRRCIAKVIKSAGIAPDTMTMIAGLACQRSSIVCWDRQSGHVLSPVISWQDTRMADWVETIQPWAKDIYQRTGLVVSPHYGASKIKWCLEHLQSVRESYQAGRLACGPLSSYILHQILAESPFLVDYCNAQRTQLFNIKQCQWDSMLAHLFGVSLDLLPACVPNHHGYGHLEVDGHEITLLMCTGDQSAMLFAHGALNPSNYYINIGTGAFLIWPSGDKPSPPSSLLNSIIDSNAQTQYGIEATVNGAGCALNHVLKMHYHEGMNFSELDHLIATSKTPALFINTVSGLGSPFWLPDMGSKFIGSEQPEDQLAGVVESIVFLLTVNIEQLRAEGHAAERIIIGGGLSASSALCQRLASLSSLPVYRYQDMEATTRGVARLLGEDLLKQSVSCDNKEIFTPCTDLGLEQRYLQWRSYLESMIQQ